MCTVLTGTRAMAMLEKTCPAIWNRLIMNVPWSMCRDAILIPHEFDDADAGPPENDARRPETCPDELL